MEKQRTKGTQQFNVELAPDLIAEARAFASNRGEPMREVVSQALRRHMDNPPPLPELPPLPPVTVEKPKKKPRGK